jgi:glycosyltransferase involved in cell wall biosynthesis
MQKKILILSYSHLKSDPRVMRQIRALSAEYRVDTAGMSDPEQPGTAFYPIYTAPAFSLARKIRRVLEFITGKYDDYYWDSGKKNILEAFRDKGYDVIIANDIHTLPLALAIAGSRSKVYFDAHEYHPKEFEDNLKWRLLHQKYLVFLCRKYIPLAQAFSTVSWEIAREYQAFSGVLPAVITNASVYHDLSPGETRKDRIRLIHHGAALPSRRPELMISMAKLLDKRFTMDFILVGDKTYIERLRKTAGGSPAIRFLPPLPPDQVCAYTNAYDLGIFLLPPTNFNYLNALPNKLFEFVQARLGIVVSPNPEMAALVSEYRLGSVSDDYTAEAMARAINCLTSEQIMDFKKNSDHAAKALSAEENMKKINAIVRELIFNYK